MIQAPNFVPTSHAFLPPNVSELPRTPEISPTGTGTLSPLPGHQRSIGRASSLADIESYNNPASPNLNPKGESGDNRLGDGDGGRRQADTGNFLERVFRGGGGGDGTDGIGDIDEHQHQQQQNNVQHGSPSSLCSPSSSQAESMVDSSRTGGGVGGTEVALDQNHESVPSAAATAANVSRTKGKKPPRVPRIRRQDSPGAGEGGGAGGGRGRGKGCKIS